MVNPNQKGPYKERILQDIHINKDLPHKEKPSPPRNECQLYTTIKTPKPSQTEVHLIYPNSDTLELWKFSNLTFGGYLAGTTLILSWSLLFLCCTCIILSTWGPCDSLTIFGIITNGPTKPWDLRVKTNQCMRERLEEPLLEGKNNEKREMPNTL